MRPHMAADMSTSTLLWKSVDVGSDGALTMRLSASAISAIKPSASTDLVSPDICREALLGSCRPAASLGLHTRGLGSTKIWMILHRTPPQSALQGALVGPWGAGRCVPHYESRRLYVPHYYDLVRPSPGRQDRHRQSPAFMMDTKAQNQAPELPSGCPIEG